MFLLVATGYYSIRLFFSLAKICSIINPLFLFGVILFYKKRDKSGYYLSGASLWEKERDTFDELFEALQLFAMDRSAAEGQKFYRGKKMPSEKEALHFMVLRPIFGFLENLVFPMLVFPGMCIFALFSLAKAIWF